MVATGKRDGNIQNLPQNNTREGSLSRVIGGADRYGAQSRL